METVETKHIVATPGTCGGKPRIAGSRIRVQDIVIWTEQGKSPDEIVTAYPHLTLAGVYAALAYYHDHQQVVDRQIREDLEFAEQYRKELLAERSGTEADGAQVSS